jgi:hypothetical protein
MSDLLSVGTSACSCGALVQVRKMTRIFHERRLRIDEDSPNVARKRRFVDGDRARKRSRFTRCSLLPLAEDGAEGG